MGLGPLEKPKTPRDFLDAPKGHMKWKKCHGKRGNTPRQMWDKCFRKHENLFMICYGDQSRTQALRRSSAADHGNIVHELLSDYGVSGLRVMRFIPAKNLIEVRTWDPIGGKLCEATKIVPDRDQHQFTVTVHGPKRLKTTNHTNHTNKYEKRGQEGGSEKFQYPRIMPLGAYWSIFVLFVQFVVPSSSSL